MPIYAAGEGKLWPAQRVTRVAPWFRVTRTGANVQADPATLDPAQSVSFVDRVVMPAVCDTLIELDAKLTYVPQLATE